METAPGYEDAATHVGWDGSRTSAEAIELRYTTKAAVHLCAFYNQATKGRCPFRSRHNPPKETKLETLIFRRWRALTTMPPITAKQLFVRMLKMIDTEWNPMQPTMEAVANVNVSESVVELETAQDKWDNWLGKIWATEIEKLDYADDADEWTLEDSRSCVEQAIDSQKKLVERAIQQYEARQKVGVVPDINSSIPSVEDIIRPNLSGDGRLVINSLLEMGGICEIDDCDQWIELPVSGQMPNPRYQHEAFELDYKMCVAGGNNDGYWFDDIQVLDLMRNTWSKVDAGAENSRLLLPTDPCSGQQLILWNDELFAIAGQTLNIGSITVKQLDKRSRTWSDVHIEGTKPMCRRGHSLTIVGDNLVIFGGEAASGNLLNDLYILNLKTMRWTDLEVIGAAPPPRSGHAAACHEGNFVFIFGGKGQDTYYNDLHKFDLKKCEWTILDPQGVIPAARAGHAGVTVGANWIIVGGRDCLAPFSETYVLNMGKVSWSFLAGRLSATEGMSLVTSSYDGVDFLISFGGRDGKGSCNNEVHVLRLSKTYDKCESDLGPLNLSDDELSSSEDEASLMFLLESKRKEKREALVNKRIEEQKELFSKRKKDLEALISERKVLQALVPKETASPDIVEKEVAKPCKLETPAPYNLDARKRKRLLLESGEADVSNPESLRSV